MEFYRSSTVGTALIKTLNELLATGEITNEQALEVLRQFDEKFISTLRNHVPLDKMASKHEATGKLVNYNNYADLWKIEMENVDLSFGSNEGRHYDRLRLLFSTKPSIPEDQKHQPATANTASSSKTKK